MAVSVFFSVDTAPCILVINEIAVDQVQFVVLRTLNRSTFTPYQLLSVESSLYRGRRRRSFPDYTFQTCNFRTHRSRPRRFFYETPVALRSAVKRLPRIADGQAVIWFHIRFGILPPGQYSAAAFVVAQ